MYIQKNYNKYNAKSQEYNGRHYHSKLEASHAQELDLMLKAGEVKEVIPQYKISLDINGMHICNYYVDFYVVMKDDSVELHEVKGMETGEFKIKRRLVEAIYLKEHPDTTYVVLKQSSWDYYRAKQYKQKKSIENSKNI